MIRVISRDELPGGRCIEQLEDEAGRVFYRACLGEVCRYCEDLWMAQVYADQVLDRPASG
jgi:hypothetical protein